MALNPPLVSSLPQAFPDEYFVLRRTGMRAIAKNPAGLNYSADGELFVSTLRMVFVADKEADGIAAIDIPLANVSEESFNQPIFGCNNLSFSLKPIAGAGLEANTGFKLEFRHGGAGTFLELFLRALHAMRETMQRAGRSPPNPAQHPFSQSVANGTFAHAVYSDPNDPSTLFVTQPHAGAPVRAANASYTSAATVLPL